jgi:hypothetical protein
LRGGGSRATLPAMLRSRRDVLLGLTATAAALTVRPAKAGTAREGARRALSTGKFPLGIAPGDRFGKAIVTRVGAVLHGAIGVRLIDSTGGSFTVDLLRRDPETPGVAQAGSLDAFVMNDGGGVLATNEEHGVAAMAIAQHLADREAAGAPAPSLLTLRERAEERAAPRRR